MWLSSSVCQQAQGPRIQTTTLSKEESKEENKEGKKRLQNQEGTEEPGKPGEDVQEMEEANHILLEFQDGLSVSFEQLRTENLVPSAVAV